eukprot:12336-Heterococcus_DN1.PRE.2
MIAIKSVALLALLASANAAWFNFGKHQQQQEQLHVDVDVLMNVQDNLSAFAVDRALQTAPEDTPCYNEIIACATPAAGQQSTPCEQLVCSAYSTGLPAGAVVIHTYKCCTTANAVRKAVDSACRHFLFDCACNGSVKTVQSEIV